MQYPENLDIPAIIGTCIPLALMLVGAVSILACNWRKAKATECRAVLVQTMLDKGFSAEEIEKVLKAHDFGRDSCEINDRRKSTKA